MKCPLQEDLAFFQNLTATRGKEGELALHRLRLERDSMPGEYRIRMLLVQSGQRAKEFSGSYQLIATCCKTGKKPHSYFPMMIRECPIQTQFQVLSARRTRHPVGPDAQLQNIQVRIFEQGVREPRVRQSVDIS